MSTTEVKKIPLASKKPYVHNWEKQKVKDKTRFFKCWIPLAHYLLNKEFESLEFIGSENVPKDGKVILISNHVNGFDPITLMYGIGIKRSAYFMAKAEFYQAFYIRWALNIFNGFPVNRDKPDRESMKFAQKVLEKEQMLVIFPAGTRDRYRKRPETEEGIKVGFAMLARDTKATVVPASIHLASDLDNHHPKCIVRYGEPIPYEEMGFTEGVRKSAELRNTSKMLMTKVQELWDMDQI